MTDEAREQGTTPAAPTLECDVVMKGGITSGVVYPRAVARLARTYRLRGVGGASAGAIGAAAGAAAEFGRHSGSGGFDALDALPAQLADGRLAALFQPQPGTRALLPILLAATGHDRPGAAATGAARVRGVVGSLVRGYPLHSVLGLLPGLVLVVVGVTARGWAGWLLAVVGLLLAVLGWALAVALGALRTLTVDVPANQFGICRGLGTPGKGPGFTDWLSTSIDDLAGLPADARPLRFGHLWSRGTDASAADPGERDIDLRTMTTCLTESRPYEMPWEARNFFYEPGVWATLFPAEVMRALEAAPPARLGLGARDTAAWEWEEERAAEHDPPLRRLPDARDLPVIVATRLSLSFPLLISAVPLWTIDRRSRETTEAVRAFRAGQAAAQGPRFRVLWFTDGGLTSNFPLPMFDAALASRPTFAINLGKFAPGHAPSEDERENVRYARGNDPVHGDSVDLPQRGVGALTGFAHAAIETARNWNDSSYLGFPGFRDKIVRVLQTPAEGGLNLYMDGPTIERLAARGRAAGDVMAERFTTALGEFAHPEDTAWDNHRWVRYRALLSTLPSVLRQWERGRAAMADLDVLDPPSYRDWTVASRTLAVSLSAVLDEGARVVREASPGAVAGLQAAPNPTGVTRRVPVV